MKPIKADIVRLSKPHFEALFALFLYHRSACFLHRESIRYIDYVAEGTDEYGNPVDFHTSARLWHGLWVASVYVVHEGFIHLGVEDTKLNRIRSKGDLDVLRRFRNATFHFQPVWRDERHTKLIMENLTGWVQELHDRHHELMGRMLRLAVRHHPLRHGRL